MGLICISLVTDEKEGVSLAFSHWAHEFLPMGCACLNVLPSFYCQM